MEFIVDGMTCGHCVRGVTRAIHAVDPQARVEVDLSTGRVLVEGKLSSPQAAQAIEGEGYQVRGRGAP